MLQDFSFKIIHRPGLRHTNVDALSRNPVGPATDDDDFSEEIQDMQILKLMHLEEMKSVSVFEQARKQNGSVSGEGIGSWYSIVLVVSGLTTVGMSAIISCM